MENNILMHFDENINNTGTSSLNLTPSTTLEYSATISKFGQSLYLTGSNSLAGTTSLLLGTDDFTIDFWVYNNGSNHDSGILDIGTNPSSDYIGLSIMGNNPSGGNNITLCVSNNGTSWAINGMQASYNINELTHVAIVRSNSAGNISIYINGIKTTTATISPSLNISQYQNNCIIGYHQWNSGTKQYFNGYLDELRIVKEAIWTANFTPPIKPYLMLKCLYIDERTTVKEVYALISGTFSKVADDWSVLSDSQKIQLFKSADSSVPTINNLSSINKFKVITYADINYAITTSLSAVAKDQTILPNELINITAYQCINNITPIQTITKSVQDSTADIRYVFTNNLIDYKVYNTSTSTWDTIDIDNIATLGMTLAQVTAVTETQWDSLLYVNGSNGLGIGFFMSKSYVADVVNIDSLSLNVDMKGSWNHAVYGTDVTYGYPTNTTLKVTLLTNGSYKINYNELTK